MEHIYNNLWGTSSYLCLFMVEICEMLIEIKSIGNESWPGGTYIFFAYCDLHGNNVQAHLDELETRIDKKYCEEPKR